MIRRGFLWSIDEFESLPWWLGRAWVDYSVFEVVAAPVPLHIPISWCRGAWFFIQLSCSSTYRERIERAAWLRGRTSGEASMQHALNNRDRELDEMTKASARNLWRSL